MFTYIIAGMLWLSSPITGGKENDWTKYFFQLSEPAHYTRKDYEFPPDMPRQWRDNVIQRIVFDSFYEDSRNINLLKLLPELKGETEQERLKEMNSYVNKAFSYWSAPANYWYAEPPVLAYLIGGDCKAYAYFKYWTLRQMGYTNVKLITVVLPNGHGSLAGHVVVVLNDLWVLDINYPYYYPFEILRESTALDEAFFSDGTVWEVQ